VRQSWVQVGLTLMGMGTGCAGVSDESEAPGAVVYRGAVTDEALARLLDQAPLSDTTQRLSVLTPEEGAVLSATAPVELAFEDSSVVLLRAPSDPVGERHKKAANRVPHLGRERGLFERLGLVRVAHAHGEPFNGRGYYLSVLDADGAALLSVFTDDTRYLPSEAEWASVAAGADPLELTLLWADFDANDIPAGGGPFLTAALRFRVE
jgi:hypothetical protein